MKKVGTKIICAIMMITMVFSACGKAEQVSAVSRDSWNTNYKYVFVHGLSGWGSYDFQNHFVKYWGMFGGDLLKKLNDKGFACYSASVNPQGSAWDRACELYAQLTGSVVDYGKEHSTRCNHERYGEDYTNRALIDKWSSDDKINLIGHSFGGATIRMLSTLMAEGSAAEIEFTDDETISPLFTGGKGDWIYSLTALAAPHNGTTAYHSDVDVSSELTAMQSFMSSMVVKSTEKNTDGRSETDYADYDMKIDNALELNEMLTTQENLYYFSVPCSSAQKQEDNTYYPIEDITEITFIASGISMGRYVGKTDGGYTLDESWQENDGLVNTISATAPFNAPSTDFDENDIHAGIWNVMPVYRGDHMSLQGGLLKTNDVEDYYTNHLNMINSIK